MNFNTTASGKTWLMAAIVSMFGMSLLVANDFAFATADGGKNTLQHDEVQFFAKQGNDPGTDAGAATRRVAYEIAQH